MVRSTPAARGGEFPGRGTPTTSARRRGGLRRGFTLLEILVVVALIAILVAIMAPSLRHATVRARRLICRARLGKLASATTGYAVDNKGVYLKCRLVGRYVQICFNPLYSGGGGPHDETDWIAQAAAVGLKDAILTCPERPTFPIVEPGFPQLVIGYQYFGGIDRWYNPSGSFAARSPVTMSGTDPRWALAADCMMKVDQVWGGGRPTAFGDMPQHRDGAPWPAGGNQCYADGSADWVDFAETIFIHSWSPGYRASYFYQDDLGTYNPPVEAYGRHEME